MEIKDLRNINLTNFWTAVKDFKNKRKQLYADKLWKERRKS